MVVEAHSYNIFLTKLKRVVYILGPKVVPHVIDLQRGWLHGHHQSVHSSSEHEVVKPKAAGGIQTERSRIYRRYEVVTAISLDLGLHAHIVSTRSVSKGVIVSWSCSGVVKIRHRTDPLPGQPDGLLRRPAALILALEVAGVVHRVVASPASSQLCAPLFSIAEGSATSV